MPRRSLAIVAVASSSMASALQLVMPHSPRFVAQPRSGAPRCCDGDGVPAGAIDLGVPEVICGSCGTWVPATGASGTPVPCSNCGASICTSELDLAMSAGSYAAAATGSDAAGAPAAVLKMVAGAATATATGVEAGRALVLSQTLLRIGAATNRGETSNPEERAEARRLASELEALYAGAASLDSRCSGTWELVLSDTQLFRSSPFFMAGRAVCSNAAEARRYDSFCELHRRALAISTIGKVRQVVAVGGAQGEDYLISELEVRAGAVPFIADILPR